MASLHRNPLGATEMGFGGGRIASIQHDRLRQLLNIPAHYGNPSYYCLGEPKERVIIVEAKNGDIKYWRDTKNTTMRRNVL